MKLLLTSAGITTKALADAVMGLVGKPVRDIRVVFIPTAANPIQGDKSWMLENIAELKAQGYASVDVLDIAGMTEAGWRPRLEAADLMCFGGGNEQYLAKALSESGLDKALPDLLRSRVYMGISAGSMVVGRFLSHELMQVVYPEEIFEELAPSLGYVDLLFIPHLNSSFFIHVRKEILAPLARTCRYPLYACDDESGLAIVDGAIAIVGTGETAVFQPMK